MTVVGLFSELPLIVDTLRPEAKAEMLLSLLESVKKVRGVVDDKKSCGSFRKV
jgi:hypothetical protein